MLSPKALYGQFPVLGMRDISIFQPHTFFGGVQALGGYHRCQSHGLTSRPRKQSIPECSWLAPTHTGDEQFQFPESGSGCYVCQASGRFSLAPHASAQHIRFLSLSLYPPHLLLAEGQGTMACFNHREFLIQVVFPAQFTDPIAVESLE